MHNTQRQLLYMLLNYVIIINNTIMMFDNNDCFCNIKLYLLLVNHKYMCSILLIVYLLK
eukprot:UN09516